MICCYIFHREIIERNKNKTWSAGVTDNGDKTYFENYM